MNELVKPSIAIFCTSLRLNEEPLSDEYFWDAYQDLMLALKARGVEPYLTCDNHTYLGGGRFTQGLVIDQKVPHPKLLTTKRDFTVDLVMERSEPDPFRGTDVPVINSQALRDIINNKISLYEHFADFQPRSIVVRDRAELSGAISTLAGERVVVKIADGFGGKGVFIGPKDQAVRATESFAFPVLVQEFVDTSGGVPGARSGVHDVRTKVCEGTIISYSIRLAKEGSLHSNISQGGTQVNLPLEDLPQDINDLVRRIDRLLPQEPRWYSADFVYSDKGIKMIELNDYVGLTANVDGPEAAASVGRLADYLAGVAKRSARARGRA